MRLSESEKIKLHKMADELADALTEAGCDAVIIGATFSNTADSTGWLFRSRGNTFACRDLARLYVEDGSRIFLKDSEATDEIDDQE